MPTSVSNPTTLSDDCIDISQINVIVPSDDVECQLPTSTTLPDLKSSSMNKPLENGWVRLPDDCTTLPADAQDLLHRLLEFHPDRRIRSIFALQRIAFFMGFNFNDAKKKKVCNAYGKSLSQFILI